MANFEFSALALKAVAPGNDLLMDDKGMPSCMVFVPKFKLSDVLSTDDDSTHPAFIVNGTERPGFWIGKFQSKSINGQPYALPCEDPTASMNLDTFVSQARAKGTGWHEVTAAEWAALALWCHKNGCEPKGNNNYGKDASESTYKAIPTYYDTGAGGKIGRVATGSGPISWSHDGTLAGIWDLNGNVWEWCTGIRLVNGEVQVIDKNNACDNATDLSASSGAWKAIKASDGTLVAPNGSGTTSGTVKLDYVSGKWQYNTTISSQEDSSRSCSFKDITCAEGVGAAAKLLLQSLAMMPDTDLTGEGIDATYGGDSFWANNAQAERCLYRGGAWISGGSAGVFHASLNAPRSDVNTSIGGRVAFIENP